MLSLTVNSFKWHSMTTLLACYIILMQSGNAQVSAKPVVDIIMGGVQIFSYVVQIAAKAAAGAFDIFINAPLRAFLNASGLARSNNPDRFSEFPRHRKRSAIVTDIDVDNIKLDKSSTKKNGNNNDNSNSVDRSRRQTTNAAAEVTLVNH